MGGIFPRPRRPARSPGGAALPILFACLALTGCAALFRSLDRSPSGLSSWDQSVRDLLSAGRFDSALAMASPERSGAGDDLLRLEYEGILAHYAGDSERSRVALEAADRLTEDRYTRSLTRTVLSFFTGDPTRAYDPPVTDRLFLHYYGALDYLGSGDMEDAAVEARRLEQELSLSAENERDDHDRGLAATMHAFAGSVFEATGRPGEAAVSYRLARRAEGELEADSTPSDPGTVAVPGPVPSARHGTVVLAVERGFVAYRVQRSVTLVLWPREYEALRAAGSGSVDDVRDGHAVADVVARRTLGLVPVSDDHGGRRGDPYLLRVAWPTYVGGRVPEARLRVVAPELGDDALPLAGETTADVSGVVRSDFARQAPGIMARTLVRAVAKRAAVEAVKKTAAKKDETLGDVVGLAANITTALLEQADTRGLDLLPARLRLLRVALPPGDHRLRVEILEAGTGRTRSIDLGVVRVPVGGVAVVPVRLWTGTRADRG
jgi:hypothetical protein